MDLKSLKRKELQSLCKKHGITANIANSLMIEKLESILENEQKNQRKGCLKRSGESSSENLGISQKNVTFVVDESKGIDGKQNRTSKRKTVRAKSEINTSENIATEPAKRTTRSKGLAESVLWSPVIEKKKVTDGPENAPVQVQENVTRPLRNRSVTVNDNNSKGGRKRKVSELKEVTTKTVEVSRSTRGRSKGDTNLGTQSSKSSEKEEETVNLGVLPSRSRPTRSGKKLDENEVEKADEVQGNRRRKVEEAVNERVQTTRSTHTTSSVLLDVGTCVFHPGISDEKSKVKNAKVKRSTRGKLAIAEKLKKEKSENQTKVADVKSNRTTRGSSKVSKNEVSLPLKETKESKKEVKKEDVISNAKRSTRSGSQATADIIPVEKSKKEKVKKQEDVNSHAKRSARSGPPTSEDIVPVEKSKKEKLKKQEDAIDLAKKSIISDTKPSEDTVPVEISGTRKTGKQPTKKSAAARGNNLANVRSTRKTSKKLDNLDSLPAFDRDKKIGNEASKVLTETENVTSPTSRSTLKAVDSEIPSPEFKTDHKSIGNVPSPKFEIGHKSVGKVRSHSLGKTTRRSKMSGKTKLPSKGGKHVSTPEVNDTKSSSEILEDVPKKLKSGTKETIQIIEDVTTPPRSTRRSTKLDTPVQHGDSLHEIVMTSSRRSAQKGSKGSGEVGSYKLSKSSKSNASKIGGEVKMTKGDGQTSTARKSLRSSSKQGVTSVGKVTGKKRTRTTAMEEDMPASLIKSSKRPRKDLPVEGKSSEIVDSSDKQLTGSEALQSDKVTETSELATLTAAKTGSILEQCSVPEPCPSYVDKIEDVSGSNMGSNINENLSPEIELEELPLKGKIIHESMDVSVDKVTEINPLESATLTEIVGESALDQSNVPESKLTQLDDLEVATGLKSGSSIDLSVDKVTETGPLGSATLTEAGTAISLDQSNVPESQASLLDDVGRADGLNLGYSVDVPADGLNLGSSVDVLADKETEIKPLEPVALTETMTGNILDQSNIPESKPSQLDDTGDIGGIKLGSSVDVCTDKETEIEPSELVTLTETVTGNILETEIKPLEPVALTETMTGNILDQSNIPESKPSQLDDTGDIGGIKLGSSVDVCTDKETEIEPSELVTLTETGTGNILDQSNVPDSEPSPFDDRENADGLSLGSGTGVAVDIVTKIVPLESGTPTALDDGNVVNENRVPESKTSQLDGLVDADGSNLGSNADLFVDNMTETEPLELETPTEIKDENVIDQNSVPESRPSQLDNLQDADGSNLDSSMNVSEDKATETEPLETGKQTTETDAENILNQINVPESGTSHLDNLDNANVLNLGSDVNEHMSSETDSEMVHLKDIHRGSVELNSEGIGGSSENLLESKEVYKSDDATLYDIVVEEPELEEVSEATDVNCSPCSPNLIQGASPMIEINTFDLGSVTPVESHGEASEDYGTRTGDSGYIHNLEKRFSTETDITHEGFEEINVDRLPGSLNVTSGMLSDVNLEEPNTAVDTLNLSQATPTFDGCSFEADDRYNQTPAGIEICKSDTQDQLYTQSLAKENNFNLEAETPTLKIHSRLGLEGKPKVEENAVFVEGSCSSAFAKKDSVNVDDTGLSTVADLSMNFERESSMERVDEPQDALMDEVAPKCSISEQIRHEKDICNVDVEIPSNTQLPTSEYNFISSTESPAREIGSQIVKDTETIRENLFSTEGNNSSVPGIGKTEYFDDMNPSNFVDVSMNIGVGDSSLLVAEKLPEPDTGKILSKSSSPGFNSANTSIDVDGEGDTIMKDLNDSRQENFDHFDEFNKGQDESMWQQYSASITREETTQEKPSSKENDSFGSLGQEFVVDETWVSRSRISHVQHYVNDDANVDQEENTEHDRTGFSNISITEEFRSVSGISDAETQEVCPREIGSPKFDSMFRDFEATISATQLSSQEERATSVQRSTEFSAFAKDDFLSNMENAKHEGSTVVGNENKEILTTDKKELSSNQSEDQEQRKSPAHGTPGSFSYY